MVATRKVCVFFCLRQEEEASSGIYIFYGRCYHCCCLRARVASGRTTAAAAFRPKKRGRLHARCMHHHHFAVLYEGTTTQLTSNTCATRGFFAGGWCRWIRQKTEPRTASRCEHSNTRIPHHAALSDEKKKHFETPGTNRRSALVSKPVAQCGRTQRARRAGCEAQEMEKDGRLFHPSSNGRNSGSNGAKRAPGGRVQLIQPRYRVHRRQQ